MTNPLKTTFDLLAATRNESAVAVLAAAMDSANEEIRASAVRALINRPSIKARMEIIRRFREVPYSALETFRGRSADFNAALTQALEHGDLTLKLNAVELIRLTQHFGHIRQLVLLLEEGDPELMYSAAETIRELVYLLHDIQQNGQGDGTRCEYVRDVPQLIHKTLTYLDSACEKLHRIIHSQTVIESILILGDAKNFAVKKVLWQSSPECKQVAAQIMSESRHQGIIQLLISQLSEKQPHPRALQAIQHRDDPEMVFELLRSIPKRLTTNQQKSLKQIEEIRWLDPNHALLQMIPAPLQPNLVTLIAATGLPLEKKAAIQQWLLRNGSAEGRNAAAERISNIEKSELQNIVLEGLGSKDESIQAWATSQLRNSNVPDAIGILVDRLDDPDEGVREAAREQLKSFDLERLLEVSEHLDTEMCLRAGEVLLKINPDTLTTLSRQLASPIRSHRLRAAKAVQRMQIQEQVLPGLVSMLDDSEVHVRRTAIEVLSGSTDPLAIAAIQNCIGDPNPRVSELARQTLQNLKKQFQHLAKNFDQADEMMTSTGGHS